MLTVDINADLGEGFPNDRRLLELVTSASVCCGAHAGDPATIRQTLVWAEERGVAVGAHPGFADRAGFGRREQTVDAEAVDRLITEQVDALTRVAEAVGARLRFVKPHGALYNQAQRDEEVAQGVVAALSRLGLPLLGQKETRLHTRARDAGLVYIREGFPERRYRPDGRLAPRTEPDAVLRTEAAVEAQVGWLIAEGYETLCVHGDDARAVENALAIRRALERSQVRPCFWGRSDP